MSEETVFVGRFIMPVRIEFKPQPDITAYELANLLPLLFNHGGLMPADVPSDPAILRHLIVDDPNGKAPSAAKAEGA